MIQENQLQRPKLVVIDGNHLIHRAFHAIQADLKTSQGEPTNAIYGFASMLLNIITLEKPSYLVVTFDERAPTFRHEAHADYKATRIKAPDALYQQIPRIREMIELFKVPLFSKAGFEADDLMGTLAKKAEQEGLDTYLITGDMDVLQLISDHIYVVFPHKGYREPILFDAKKVKERYGVHPQQIVDYKALVGDPSDNLEGVMGIGPKGAIALLLKYGTLQEIYNHIDELSPALKQRLLAGQKSAFFTYSLARIVTDVPCEFSKQAAAFESLDFKSWGRFLETVEIHSLSTRLQKIIPLEARQHDDQLKLF